MKLVAKTRHGAKVHKVYDEARTPYQRLLESSVLTEAKRGELAAVYHGLNPVMLLKQINGNLEKLWTLAERPTPRPKVTPKSKEELISVTGDCDATMHIR